jgi:hypothetical protein
MLTMVARAARSLSVATMVGLLILWHTPAQAANPVTTIKLNPIVEANGNDSDFDSHWDTVHDSPNSMLAYNGLPSTYNYRVALEFDLESIPANATIVGASFHIHYDGSSGDLTTPSLQFNSYGGNGTIELADFEQVNPIGGLRLPVPPAGSLWFNVPVASQLQSFLDQRASHLGIMIQNVIANQTAFLSSLADDPALRPYLAVTFAIPEPTTAALLFMGVCGLVPRIRRRD